MKDFIFPKTVEGWLSPAEGQALAELAADRRVLEIGAWCGKSTICIAQTAAVTHSIDHHLGDKNTGARDTFSIFLANLKQYQVDDKVVLHKSTWQRSLPLLPHGFFDVIFVDHDHDRPSVEATIQMAKTKLAPWGVWAFHDYANRDFPGVKDAVDQLTADGTHRITVVDSMAIVETEGLPSLSVVIPTIGRPTLHRTLESIRRQRLQPYDEVLVVGDGRQPTAEAAFHSSGLPGTYLSFPGPAQDWGHTPRNKAMPIAKGQFLLHIDDDDYYVDNAFETIRRALATNPGKPHMFKMQRPSKGDTLWNTRDVRCGNVSTQMFVHPNGPERMGKWTPCYEGDYDFIVGTMAKWPDNTLVWREEVIAVWAR